MSAQEFEPGDRVRTRNGVGTVRGPNAPATVEYDDGGWDSLSNPRIIASICRLDEHAEPEDKDDLYVEPEPLRNGVWAQAWVRVVDASVIGGEVTICAPRMEGDWRYLSGAVRISEDALIRTKDVPPWVQEEVPVTVTISGTRVFSEESGAPMVRLETGPGSYALIPVANISSITEGGAS